MKTNPIKFLWKWLKDERHLIQARKYICQCDLDAELEGGSVFDMLWNGLPPYSKMSKKEVFESLAQQDIETKEDVQELLSIIDKIE